MCVHACHSWYSSPAKSVILCLLTGSGDLTVVTAAATLSFIQYGTFTVCMCVGAEASCFELMTDLKTLC